MKKWKPKNVKLTSITRLRKLDSPIPMVGCPHSMDWERNCRLNYEKAIKEKMLSKGEK